VSTQTAANVSQNVLSLLNTKTVDANFASLKVMDKTVATTTDVNRVDSKVDYTMETCKIGNNWNWPSATLLTARHGTSTPNQIISYPINCVQLAWLSKLVIDPDGTIEEELKQVINVPARSITLGDSQYCTALSTLMTIKYGNVTTFLTAQELTYLDGVTSNIQTQLNTVNTELASRVTQFTTALTSKLDTLSLFDAIHYS
jgi:hypothetical protein